MPKGKAKIGRRDTYTVKCNICGKSLSHTGMNGHISSHGKTVEEYVLEYGEYRQNKVKESRKVECLECGIKVKSARELTFHLRIEHSMTGYEYGLKHYLNGKEPCCGCGCGKPVRTLPRPPWRVEYLPGHNPNGMSGKFHTVEAREVMSSKSISRFQNLKKHDTLPEKQFREVLERLNIKYESQVLTPYGVCDFKLEDGTYVEIDGEYWHPLELKDLNIQQLTSAVNDYRKNQSLRNLIRIRSSDISKIQSVDDLTVYDSKRKYPTGIEHYRTKVLTKEYLIQKCTHQPEYFKQHIYLLLRFIRAFQANFPQPESSESILQLLKEIPKKSKTVFNIQSGIYNNNCSSLGVSYLKSLFKSYWKSSYKGNKSPVEIWNDDRLMTKIITYRIGLNTVGETFDFSLHQLIRGIAAIRGTVSFFKPVLAGAIYSAILGENKAPIVLDPCAGFGGRLLGFKSQYPSGIYIGLEPNIETYNELLQLKKEAGFNDDVQLLNIKFEDYKEYSKHFDLVFTSIPYYDVEQYSNNVKYTSKENWEQEFIQEFFKYRNVVLNVPLFMEHLFTCFKKRELIQHNASHLSALKTKQEALMYL